MKVPGPRKGDLVVLRPAWAKALRMHGIGRVLSRRSGMYAVQWLTGPWRNYDARGKGPGVGSARVDQLARPTEEDLAAWALEGDHG